jgi:hypothetical protein
LEGYAALVVLPSGGLEIQIHDGDLAAVSGREVEQRGAKNGVIGYFDCATVFEDEKRRGQRRIGIYGGGLFLSTLSGVRWRGILRWRNVRAFPGAAAIENRRTALVIGVIVCCIFRLVLWRGAVDRIRHRVGIPSRADCSRVLMVATTAITVAVPVVPVALPVVEAVAVSGKNRTMERRSVTLRPHGGDAGAGGVNGIAAETR